MEVSMIKQKTGTSMGSIVITKKAIDKHKINIKKSNARNKRATICIECESNAEGYCNKYSAWCGKVNYLCLGIKNPYEYKIPKAKKASTKKGGYSKKNNRDLQKLMDKYNSNPNEVITKLKKKYKIE